MATKKTNDAKKAKPAAETAAPDMTTDARNVLERMQVSFRELSEALRDSGGKIAEGNRELALRVLSHAQANAETSFETLRQVVAAESVGDALKVQQDALRDALERNLEQAKDVGELVNENRKTVMAPVTALVRDFRDGARSV